MRAWPAIALLACSSSLHETATRDVRQSVQVDAVSSDSDDTTTLQDTVETLHVGELVTTEEWSEPVAEPDGGTVLVPHRRTTTRGPVERTVHTAEHTFEDKDSSSRLTIDAGTVEHVATETVKTSRPSFGFQLWLVLIPAALLAAALVARRFYA